MFEFRSLEKFDWLVCGVSEVGDGNMSFLYGSDDVVEHNRRKFLGRLGLSDTKIVPLSCSHGDEMAVVTGDEGLGAYNKIGVDADAGVLVGKGGLLLVTADCLPIVIVDVGQKIVGLVHGGWRSTDLGIVKKVVGKMVDEFGTDARTLQACIGPGIAGGSYVQKNPEQRNNSAWTPYLGQVTDDDYAVDLVGFNVDQLADAGVKRDNIELAGVDTYTDGRFFSHRRSADQGEAQARFATVVGVL